VGAGALLDAPTDGCGGTRVNVSPSSVVPDEAAQARRLATVVFTTEHVVVRPYSLRTFDDLHRVAAVPELHRHMFLGAPMTDARLKAIVRYERRRWIATGAAHWMAYRTRGELLGVCGFQPSIVGGGGLEIDIGILPEVRGQAVVVDLYRALVDHGFGVLGQPKLHALSITGHPSARRFGEKEGAVYVRTVEVVPGMRMEHFELTPGSVAAARRARPCL
jgi:RimJ/RimL family protein N-acetyltransferase